MAKKTEINTIELYAVWYFQELKDNGYIKEFTREPETLLCAEKHKEAYLQRFKRKDNVINHFNLFQDVNYTYDYRVVWDKSARYLFYDLIDKDDPEHYFKFGRPFFIANYEHVIDGETFKEKEVHVSRIDVKPTHGVARFGKVSSSITFVYKQRMLFDFTGIYIEKFIPIPMAGSGKRSSRFINSFTPKRYMMTDGGKMIRKIRFPINDLRGYLKKRNEELDHLGMMSN